jgi:hypothetical protein
MTAQTKRHGAPSAVVDQRHQVSTSQQEKAERWDHLNALLLSPEVRNTYVRHLSAMRRAALMLLAYREELPTGLLAELKTYMTALDELHLEAIDGFAGTEGVLNLLPAFIIESTVGELCQPDSEDDELSETPLDSCAARNTGFSGQRAVRARTRSGLPPPSLTGQSEIP